jgi:glycosyltransferase involved in cell wall biosynthesis
MTPPSESREKRANAQAGSHKGLTILLAGAFLPWYDYGFLASALAALVPDSRSAMRMILLGGNPRMPEMEQRVKQTFSKAGVAQVVEFVGVVPFSRRHDQYDRADVGLSISPPTIEDELSARTRIVDYLGSGLPIIARGSDEYSREIIEAGAGFSYDANPESLARILETLVADRGKLEQARSNIDALLSGPFNAALAARPVLDFIDEPRLTHRNAPSWLGLKLIGLWLRDLAEAMRTGRL